MKIGDKVLCVDSKPLSSDSGFPTGLVAGQEYTVQNIHSCKITIVNVGVSSYSFGFSGSHCPACNYIVEGTILHYAWRFVKIDPWLQESDLDLQLQEDIEKSRRVIRPPEILIHQGNTK